MEKKTCCVFVSSRLIYQPDQGVIRCYTSQVMPLLQLTVKVTNRTLLYCFLQFQRTLVTLQCILSDAMARLGATSGVNNQRGLRNEAVTHTRVPSPSLKPRATGDSIACYQVVCAPDQEGTYGMGHQLLCHTIFSPYSLHISEKLAA